MKVLILHNEIKDNSTLDEKDTMDQVMSVFDALNEMNHTVRILPFTFNIEHIIENIKAINPDIIFNLVESVDGSGRLIYFGSAVLDYLKIPYTGNSTEAIFQTSNKLIAKDIMEMNSLPTSNWITLNDKHFALLKDKFIIKSIWEHASINMDETSIISTLNIKDIYNILEERNDCFAEEYIDGREFSISIISTKNGIEVLPPAEMIFTFPENKNKVIDYKAKWDTDSFEYKNINRNFKFNKEDQILLDRLKYVARDCWNVFNLNGYARIDFRVDKNNNIYVIDINCNPCISKDDSGFTKSCKEFGIEYNQMIQILLDNLIGGYQ